MELEQPVAPLLDPELDEPLAPLMDPELRLVRLQSSVLVLEPEQVLSLETLLTSILVILAVLALLIVILTLM